MTSSVFSTIRIQALFFLLLFCTTTNAQNDTTVVLHDIPINRISHMDYNSGSLLIAASDEWAIMYPETGMQIFASRFSDSRIISTCFLPDGRYAAFLLEDIKTKHTVLKICDISNAEVVANLKAPAGVSFTSMAVWGAENLLLIAGSDGTLRFFDWKFQKTTQSIKLYNGKRAVSLSAGGNYAIIADETQTAYWIDLSKKKVIKSFGVYNGYKGCPLTISPSGQKVYWTNPFPKPRETYAFYLKTMTLDNSTPQIIDSILYFTENRKLVMLDEETLVATSGGTQQRIRLYKSNVFQAVPYEKNQVTEPEQFVVMPNGILIASHGRYDGIVFYDIWDVKKLKEFSAHSSVLTADFMPNGHLLLEDRHGVVIVGANGPVRYFQDKDISHDKWPCLSHTFSFYDYWNDTLEVYDSNTFKHIVDIKSLNGYPPEVSIDGKYYKERGDSTIYDIYTQKIAEKVPPDICFNPQKCKLPKIIEKVTNYEYDYFLKPPGSTKEILLEEPGFQIRIITGHPFAVDAKMTKIAVEAITRDPIRKTAILIFDIHTGKKLHRLDLPYSFPEMRSVFFTPNPDIIGFTALSAGSSMIQLWNVKTNRKAADLFFPLDNPYDFIIYTPDGRIDGSEQALEYRYHLEVNGKVIPKEGVLKITPGLLFQIVQEKK